MITEEEALHLLTQIGLTKTQAKIYLALLKSGRTDGKTLAEKSDSPRTVVYRTLDELQEMGLVEKEIASPYKYNATPVRKGMQILMMQKLQKIEESREKTKKFLLKYEKWTEEKIQEPQYKFTIIKGKEKIIQTIKLHHNNVQKTVRILSTMQRWLQILHYCYEDYVKALARGVKYQVLVETGQHNAVFPAYVDDLLNKPNFELRLTNSHLATNLGLFDHEQASLIFFTSMPLSKSPIICSNHPGFLSMCEDHFAKTWQSAPLLAVAFQLNRNAKKPLPCFSYEQQNLQVGP